MELYSKKRVEFRTGDLLAWKTTKINSFFDFILFLYQKILKAQFTHVGIVVRFGDRLFILEATPPAVRLYPISLTDDFYYIRTNIDENPTHVDLLLKDLGKKYSIFDVIRSAFKLGTSNTDYYCSELASYFYNEIGYIDDQEAGFTPDTIVEAILNKAITVPIPIKTDRGNLNGV